MRVFVTGTRGIPHIPGGVERHCQELYPLIAAKGHWVAVASRTPYIEYSESDWEGVHLVPVFAPRLKSLEAIVHTFWAVIQARLRNSQIVHIHAVGPGLLAPIARLLGLKVVFTNHGPDYARQKWTGIAKHMLRFGEWLGGRFAHEVIVISRPIQDIVQTRCKRRAVRIPNGVPVPEVSSEVDQIRKYDLEPRGYILAVARFVPEKGLHDLIQAFSSLSSCYKLVIAGDADHETEYSHELRRMAQADSRVMLTGYVTGESLHQLYSHAGLFVLPSYHEGLPIALLEAMSYGLPVLVSDIPANREVRLDEKRYFMAGDVDGLQKKLGDLLHQELTDEERESFQQQIAENYNWENIAEQTLAVYERVLSPELKRK